MAGISMCARQAVCVAKAWRNGGIGVINDNESNNVISEKSGVCMSLWRIRIK